MAENQDTPASEAPEVIPVPAGYQTAKRLASGKIIAIKSFKGEDLMEIFKVAGSKLGSMGTTDMLFYVIAYCVMYDGQKLNFESLKEIDGFDLLELMGEFQGKL